MTEIKHIRTLKNGQALYFRLFKEASKLSDKDFWNLKHSLKWPRADYTEQLTSIRKQFIEKGYAKEVKETDELFLQKRSGLKSDKFFEECWIEYVNCETLKHLNLAEKYKDAI